jgi:hypothetical protein
MGDVIDSDGWDVGSEPSGLPVAGPHRDVIEGDVVEGRVDDAGSAEGPNHAGDHRSRDEQDPGNSNRDRR